MDSSIKKEKKPNPAENASIFSVATLMYMFPIFKRTYKHEMTQDDLFRPLETHKSDVLGEKLESIWREEHRKHKKSALHRALFKLFGAEFMWIGFVKVLDECFLVVVMPLGIGKLVGFFEKGQTDISLNEAYLAAIAIVFALILDCFVAHPSMMVLMHLSMKMRVACSSLLYRKTLRLSSTALASTTIGEAVNLLSNDVNKFEQGFVIAHFLWIGPIQTAVGTYLIYRQIGVAAFFGMAFLLSFIPAQIWLGKRTSVLRLKTALRTDERVRLMNEIISGIQVIKMYCWEKPFSQLIHFARKREMKAIRSNALLLGLVYSFEMFVTRVSIFVSILGYALLGNYISADKVFAITAVYNVLRPVVTLLFSLSISSIAQVHISVVRLQNFLSYEEKTLELENLPIEQNGATTTITNSEEKNNSIDNNSSHNEPKIVLANISAKWLKDSNENTLKNISLNISPRDTVAIIGPVGSGKSSLLNVLLKELPVNAGKMYLHGTVSYSCQEPWLFGASVQKNILFGAKFDHDRYQEVVEVCALRSDFKLLPFGDKTLVSERGKSLSGGQKARINLARSIYKKADIYLLDDPLSAVDANVGKHLYERCIQGFLKDKICILITHQLQYLSDAEQIVIMKDGCIERTGTWNELQTSGLDFAKLMVNSADHNIAEESDEIEKPTKPRSRATSVAVEEKTDFDEQQAEEEEMGVGAINCKLYYTYFRAGGSAVAIILLVLVFLMCQFVANAGDYYISYWVNVEYNLKEKRDQDKLLPTDIDYRNTVIYIYSGITLATVVLAVFHSAFFMMFLAIASVNLHKTSFTSIINASMRFFNVNPSGRILNRFSKDLGYIDEYIPPVFFELIEIGLLLAGTLILTFIVDIWLILPSLVLLVIFYYFRMVYIKTSRSVKRIEGITRSPIFGHMTASMLGVSTIRAFSAEKVLIKEFDQYQDQHSSAWFLFIASNRCFGLWLDLISITFIGVAIFILLAFHSNLYGGEIGLVITQYIGLIGSLQWGMRQWSELENHMVSVERLVEYKSVESEPVRKSKSILSKEWPASGRVEFKDVSLKYNPTDPCVLKELNFVIEPKEKIGIVGRTGAGKTSIITALFQLYEIEGSVIVDGEDTTKLPLQEMRTKISIIPQEPVLFSGTMRTNLDPFEEYNDETLWNALEQVELKDVISELPAGLHSNVSEGGANFSVGQRQLVCLARALIRHNKILVMDEATANVDPYTDALIQTTIREKFGDCTVLTIAHRLHTVMDSDKILVMDAGRVQEFDHPYNLLQNEEGILHSLVKTTGKMTCGNLTRIAKESYENKKKNN